MVLLAPLEALTPTAYRDDITIHRQDNPPMYRLIAVTFM